jgi:molecular chaperone GrpE
MMIRQPERNKAVSVITEGERLDETQGENGPSGPADSGHHTETSGYTEDENKDELLEEALREKEQFKRLAQRAQADLINYRQRASAERREAEQRALRRFAHRIMDVTDQFDAALSDKATAGVESKWLEGVDGIRRILISALASQGFEPFESHGDHFDPRRHEALLSTPTADMETGQIIKVLRVGYTHNGDVVRPAQVEIAASAVDQT